MIWTVTFIRNFSFGIAVSANREIYWLLKQLFFSDINQKIN